MTAGEEVGVHEDELKLGYQTSLLPADTDSLLVKRLSSIHQYTYWMHTQRLKVTSLMIANYILVELHLYSSSLFTYRQSFIYCNAFLCDLLGIY